LGRALIFISSQGAIIVLAARSNGGLKALLKFIYARRDRNVLQKILDLDNSLSLWGFSISVPLQQQLVGPR
jgi:hypothetical protein